MNKSRIKRRSIKNIASVLVLTVMIPITTFADVLINDHQDFQGAYDIMDVLKIGIGTGTASITEELEVNGTVLTDDIILKDSFVDVRHYGAVGDGITDDTSAVQNAFDAVGTADGGTVFLPKGVYAVETLSLSDNTTVIGGGTLQKLSGSNGAYHIVDIYDKSNITLIGITIDAVNGGGVYPDDLGSYHNLLIQGACKNIKIIGCTFRNAERDAISITRLLDDGGPPENIVIKWCLFDTATRMAISPTSCDSVIIRNNIIYNMSRFGINCESNDTSYNQTHNARIAIDGNILTDLNVTGGSIAIQSKHYESEYASGFYDVSMTNNIISDSRRGIHTVGHGEGFQNTVIYGNTFFGTKGGVYLNSKNAYCGSNGVFDMLTSDSHPIFSGSKNAVIMSNIVDKSPNLGIRVQNDGSLVSNNIVSNGGQDSAATFKYGLYVRQSENCIVDGNLLYDDQATHTQERGLIVDYDAVYGGTNNIVSNNLCFGNIRYDLAVAQTDLQLAVEGNSPATYDRVRIGMKMHTYGTAAPTSDSWSVGDVCWKTDPSAGGLPGWVCTTAGSPGTWKAMANLAN